MKTVLIISSQVAASQVGAGVSQFCLNMLGHNTVVLPTVLLGRHPGWGAPGGGPVKTVRLAEIMDTVLNQPITFDAVLTGYMASKDQIELACKAIQTVREKNPNAIICVDPIMGDHGALYIDQPVADALIEQLIPLADIITPNLWELGYILDMSDLPSRDMIQTLAPSVIVSSYPAKKEEGGELGALMCTAGESCLITHDELSPIPNGSGDCLAALFLSHILCGENEAHAFQSAVSSTFDILKAAHANHDKELPLVRECHALLSPARLPMSCEPQND